MISFSKYIKSFSLLVGFSAFASISMAQNEMKPLFTIESDGQYPWFSADSTTRGMAFNPKGSLLVADRKPEDAVYRLDPISGIEIGRLNTATISGGTFPLNKIAVSMDGRIILSNLALPTETASSSLFRIYYYYNETSNPVVIYEESSVEKRWGDEIAVHGIGSRMKIAVSGSDNGDIMILSDSNGDGIFTADYITPINPTLIGTGNLAFDLDAKSIWIRQSTGAKDSANHYTLEDGLGTGRKSAFGERFGPIDMVMMDKRAMFGVSQGLDRESFGSNPAIGQIIDIDISSFPKWQTGDLKHSSGLKDNINGSGDVSIDPISRRAYFLFSNNTISGWQIPFE